MVRRGDPVRPFEGGRGRRLIVLACPYCLSEPGRLRSTLIPSVVLSTAPWERERLSELVFYRYRCERCRYAEVHMRRLTEEI